MNAALPLPLKHQKRAKKDSRKRLAKGLCRLQVFQKIVIKSS
jgi:hypothetical protein